MKKGRLIGFVIFILIGFVLGLIYGWVLNPAAVKSTSLASLRADFKADYVVMVSEVYATNQDIDAAIKLLDTVTSGGTVVRTVQDALLVGQQFGFSEREMRSLAALEMALTAAPDGGSQ